jgi:hypothetical protein
LDQAEDGQAARLAGQLEDQGSRAPVAHSAILAAGVDEELVAVTGLEVGAYAIGGIVREVVYALEKGPLFGLDRRLRVALEELIATLPESLQSVGTPYSVQVADSPPPID